MPVTLTGAAEVNTHTRRTCVWVGRMTRMARVTLLLGLHEHGMAAGIDELHFGHADETSDKQTLHS